VAQGAPPAPTSPSATKTAAVEPARPPAQVTNPSPETPTATPTPPTAATPAPASAGAAKPAHSSSFSPSSSLDEEVLAIDRARRSLAAGDFAGALEEAAAYDARYPAGALLQESAEIRIEALFRSGKRGQAEKLAAKFLTQNPASPYARVIRALLSAPPE